jgi:hypothetical protein
VFPTTAYCSRKEDPTMKKTLKKSFSIKDLVRISDLRAVVGGAWNPGTKKEIVGTRSLHDERETLG